MTENEEKGNKDNDVEERLEELEEGSEELESELEQLRKEVDFIIERNGLRELIENE